LKEELEKIKKLLKEKPKTWEIMWWSKIDKNPTWAEQIWENN
jgi:hypothetical protein